MLLLICLKINCFDDKSIIVFMNFFDFFWLDPKHLDMEWIVDTTSASSGCVREREKWKLDWIKEWMSKRHTVIHTHTNTHILRHKDYNTLTHTHMQSRMHAYMHACTHIYSIYTHTHATTHTYAHAHTYFYTQMHTLIYVHATHTHIRPKDMQWHACTQAHKHTNTHTSIVLTFFLYNLWFFGLQTILPIQGECLLLAWCLNNKVVLVYQLIDWSHEST